MQNELMEALDGQQEIYQLLWENGWVFLGMGKVPVTENNLDVLVAIAVNQDFVATVQPKTAHLNLLPYSRLSKSTRISVFEVLTFRLPSIVVPLY